MQHSFGFSYPLSLLRHPKVQLTNDIRRNVRTIRWFIQQLEKPNWILTQYLISLKFSFTSLINLGLVTPRREDNLLKQPNPRLGPGWDLEEFNILDPK